MRKSLRHNRPLWRQWNESHAQVTGIEMNKKKNSSIEGEIREKKKTIEYRRKDEKGKLN